jgi:predicted ferric reductase
MKQDESDINLEFTKTIKFRGDHQKRTKDNFKNGKEYTGLTKSPYHNLMLDQQVLKTKKKLVGHKLFLPQEVVQREIWTKGL